MASNVFTVLLSMLFGIVMPKIETTSVVYSKIYQDEPRVPPGKQGFKAYPIKVEFAKKPGYSILINLRVKWARREDIGFYIFDEQNYQIWSKMLEAMARGKRDYESPYALVSLPRVRRGEFKFKPPFNGTYHIVLDNRYSVITSKSVIVEITEVWYEVPSGQIQKLETMKPLPPTPVEEETGLVSLQTKEYVERQLQTHDWKDVLRELDRAERAYNDGRMGDCCNNLRMALITLWIKIYETLEHKSCPIKPGKSVDISPLINSIITHGMPEDLAKDVGRIWSFISERAHIEKRGGVPPPESETRYGLQQTFATVEYLLQFAS